MKIWNYDADTLQLVGESEADPDPRSPGMFLIPAHAATVAPLPAVDGKTVHFDAVSSVWFYRDVPPSPAPEPAPVVPRAEQIRSRLYDIDAESVRPSREIAAALAAGVGVADYPKNKLAALEAEAAALRTELATL